MPSIAELRFASTRPLLGSPGGALPHVALTDPVAQAAAALYMRCPNPVPLAADA
jgi:hypothetical protein